MSGTEMELASVAKAASKRYLLVGGSNSIIRDGYGATLEKIVPGRWINRSLGNSPSLRGVDFLLSHPEEVSQADHIIFEYALNDMIFENANTLDPHTHLAALHALVADQQIAAKLVIVMLVGSGALARVRAGQSYVADHYYSLAKEHGIAVIDMIPMILVQSSKDGLGAVFKDNDHFSEGMIEQLAVATAKALNEIQQNTVLDGQPLLKTIVRISRVDPLQAKYSFGIEESEFKTSLLSTRLCRFGDTGKIEVMSPGGLLMGCYVLRGRNAGILRITTGRRDVVKTMRSRFDNDKFHLSFWHLTMPISTSPDDKITLSRISTLDDAAGAILDPTLAQVANATGGEVTIGDLLFLQY